MLKDFIIDDDELKYTMVLMMMVEEYKRKNCWKMKWRRQASVHITIEW